jgi:streptomycin 3"-adenylyltransferase
MTVDLAESDRGQVADVVDCLRAVLGEALVGAYLHGSAVLGGLRPGSDLDVLAVNARPTTDAEKDDLVDRLLVISGNGPAEAQPCPVELTVVVGSEVRPWRYPPRRDFQYGEWWRDRFERRDPDLWRSKEDSDVAILVSMTLLADTPLTGPSPSDVFDSVPRSDFMEATLAELPGLMRDDPDENTRNVALTLARVWHSVTTGDIGSKDEAADWALVRLAPEHRAVLERARDLYLGIGEEDWEDLEQAIPSFKTAIQARIRSAAEGAHP